MSGSSSVIVFNPAGISIDDAELYNLKKLCDEVFGEENYVATLVYDKNRKNDAKYFSVGHEYILVYFKSAATVYDLGTVFRATKEGIDEVKAEFDRLCKIYGNDWTKVNDGLKALYASWPDGDERKSLARFTRVDERGPYRDDGNINWPGGGGPMYDVIHPIIGKPCKKPISGWRYPSPERLKEEIDKGHVVFGKDETTVPRVRTNLFDADKEVLRSVHFSYAQTATNEFVKIFDGKRVFDNPKSVNDIIKLVKYITIANDNDIILDFFSGSATTAHAVMQLNAEDGGNRRFIMVQLPEVCDEKSEAFKAGYKNICEIGKERIRRAGAKIRADAGMLANNLDTSFRVFKLDSSNLKIWDNTPITNGDLLELENRLRGMLDCVKTGRTDIDVVYEVMLKLGQDLCEPIISIDLGDGRTVYGVGADVLFIVCLAPRVTPEDAQTMAEYAPGRIVFSDMCFDNATDKSNVKLTLRDRGITIKVL